MIWLILDDNYAWFCILFYLPLYDAAQGCKRIFSYFPRTYHMNRYIYDNYCLLGQAFDQNNLFSRRAVCPAYFYITFVRTLRVNGVWNKKDPWHMTTKQKKLDETIYLRGSMTICWSNLWRVYILPLASCKTLCNLKIKGRWKTSNSYFSLRRPYISF